MGVMEIDGIDALYEIEQGAVLVETEWVPFTQGDLDAFAELTGDNNPVHIDPAACERGEGALPSIKTTIVHGRFLGDRAIGALVQGLTIKGCRRINVNDADVIDSDFGRAVPVEKPVKYVCTFISAKPDERNAKSANVVIKCSAIIVHGSHEREAMSTTITILLAPEKKKKVKQG